MTDMKVEQRLTMTTGNFISTDALLSEKREAKKIMAQLIFLLAFSIHSALSAFVVDFAQNNYGGRKWSTPYIPYSIDSNISAVV